MTDHQTSWGGDGSGRGPGPTTTERIRALAALVVPVVLAALVGTLLVDSWRSVLPDPVATHFGFIGHPNGFTSVGWVIAMPAIAGVIALLIGIPLVVAMRDSSIVRSVVGLMAGTEVFVVAVMVLSVVDQRHLTDARDARWQWWILIAAAALAATVGALAALFVPRWWSPPPENDPDLELADLAPTERFVWTRTVTMFPPLIFAIIAVVVIVTVVILTHSWGVIIVGVVVLLLAGFLAIRVTVDRRAVSIASWIGWPRIVIPIDSVERADVVEVSAVRDFGGWGYRFGLSGALRGTKGFVLRSGPALVVRRTSGRSDIVVVVDDADVAAGLINSTLGQASGSGRSQSR